MSTLQLFSLYAMLFLYCFAGISHFWKPKIFLSITPKWVPFPGIVNILVGIIEIALGILLLVETTRSYAAIGIIALLIAVFPANVYHFQKARRKGKLVVPTLIRLPIQLLLIYWAYTFV
ncbi:DoxX family protein [Kordia sp. YSTF-M3]|uniref:DoxX family protein n=1 Tax=Kordia aestuariivivens TaxID=2759037 RepID=A0ABR7Q6A2_9FLAO|nr:MauE/DoxX family redox-associated membrane protein [Kordia aestuariivivens]MBC8753876.1 DoxX family protein [Kordia aestuariivivens]